MFIAPTIVTGPTIEPLTLDEVKAFRRIDGAWSDLELTGMIRAAREHVELMIGRALITRTVRLRASCFADLAPLPLSPLQAVTAIRYLATDGAEQLLDPAAYRAIDGLDAAIVATGAWPTTAIAADAVRAEVRVGFGDTAKEVPEPIRIAMLLIIGDWDRNREDTNVGNIVSSMPNGLARLLENYRRFA